jgi:hypothetical protein
MIVSKVRVFDAALRKGRDERFGRSRLVYSSE